MFHFNLPQPSAYVWQAEEVIRELDKKPHLLMRIEIIGPYFPHRAAEPFVRIIDSQGNNTTESWFAEISEDNRRLLGYFTNKFPSSGRIEFGYGNTPAGTLEELFENKKIKTLDREQLSREVVVATPEHIKERQVQD